MGCLQSKERGAGGAGSDGSSTADPKKIESTGTKAAIAQAQPLVRALLEQYWAHLERSCEEEIRAASWLTFLNTLTTFACHKHRLAFSEAKNAVLTELERMDIPAQYRKDGAAIAHHVNDESLESFIEKWFQNAVTVEDTISVEAAKDIAAELCFTPPKKKRDEAVTFDELFSSYYSWYSSPETKALFLKLSDGEPIMSTANVAKLLRSQGRPEDPPLDSDEVIMTKFGGALTHRNFATFFGTTTHNCILDPQKSSTIWHDMTLPLPSYFILTTLVNSMDGLQFALTTNTRAFVVHSLTWDTDGAPAAGAGGTRNIRVAADLTLAAMLQTLAREGFKTNQFPIILCLTLRVVLPLEVQTEVASLIQEHLGPQLAKGLMFEGATLTDPLFSPAALRGRFLVMASQAPLNPFVGLFVADMQRRDLGVKVTDVKGATPAAKAGILKDDWLTHINGVPIPDKSSLKSQLALLSLGQLCTVKKENLEEVRIVVGGSIAKDTPNWAKALSDLIFLRFEPSKTSDFAPWDVTEAPPSSPKDDMTSHFGFNLIEHAPDVEAERQVVEASSHGTQFVEVVDDGPGVLWADAAFADNGGCGYILKKRRTDEGPVSESFRLTLLAAPHVSGAARKYTHLRVTPYGEATSVEGEATVEFTVEPQHHPVIKVELLQGPSPLDAPSFIGALPVDLLRPGYHAFLVRCKENGRLSHEAFTCLCLLQQL